MKENKKIIRREIGYTLILFLFFIGWWTYFAFMYPSKNPKEYEYILGFPKWFFYSTIIGYLVFNLLVILVVKFLFNDIDLEDEV